MSAACHRCGAFDPAGTQFRSERIPLRGTRVYCPKCHAKLEEKFLLGSLLLSVVFGLIGIVYLFLSPSSEVGHVFVNVSLIQLTILPSIVIHEFAHAIIGRLSGLNVLGIWIGRGKTFYRANIFGFDTEFKIVPIGGLTFLTHGFKERLRIRYFLTILAGPLTNVIILVVALKYISWRNFDLGSSIQFATIVFCMQVFILIENLLPYRMRTSVGKICTDGLSLFQLLVSKSPDVLSSRLGIHIANTTQTQTRTG